MYWEASKGVPTPMPTTFPLPDLPEQMQTVTANDGRAPTLQSVPVPTPVNAEALIRVAAAGVTPPELTARAPRTEGPGFCGVVVATPYVLSPFSVGQRVYGTTDFPRAPTPYAEYTVSPVDRMAPAPKTLDDVQAAALATAGPFAWGMVVELARAHTGQHLLVLNAAGPIGLLSVQLGAYFGATVHAVAGESHFESLRALGAAEVLPQEDAEAWMRERPDVILDLTDDDDGSIRVRTFEVLPPKGLLITLGGGATPHWGRPALRTDIRDSGYWSTTSPAVLGVLGRLADAGDLHVEASPLCDLAGLPGVLASGIPRHGSGVVVPTAA